MLPEILTVIVDDGARTHVPLTPSTTFQDVAECVRDPGEQLPLILEQSPAGIRLVASWEHPLEVLKLWGELKSQLNFIASYNLTKQVQNEDTRETTKWLNPHQISVLKEIDPWELYDLRDQLKGINIFQSQNGTPSYNSHNNGHAGRKINTAVGLFPDGTSDAESPATSSSALSYDANETLDNRYNSGIVELSYNPNQLQSRGNTPINNVHNVLNIKYENKYPVYHRLSDYYTLNKDVNGGQNVPIKNNALKRPFQNGLRSSERFTSSTNQFFEKGTFSRNNSNPYRKRVPAIPFNGNLEQTQKQVTSQSKTRQSPQVVGKEVNASNNEKLGHQSPKPKKQLSSHILNDLSSELPKNTLYPLTSEEVVNNVESQDIQSKYKLHAGVVKKDTEFLRSMSERGRRGGLKEKFWGSKSLHKSKEVRERPKSDPQVDQIKDYLIRSTEVVTNSQGANRLGKNEGMKNIQSNPSLIPDGGEVTVPELREMASRQQHQIETQQQLLVAREQRLKYLKMQEGKSTQINQESEKLRRLRERVEAQEAKLRRLRALRGQVDLSNLSSASLSSDLDAMRSLFSEKEKELVMAAAKVEELTRQLEDLRTGRGAATSVITAGPTIQKHHQELDKLRRELLYRNSVNREASVRVASQREALATRKEEIVRIDKRIGELHQRLQRKKILNQQLSTQISSATQAKQAQLKAIEQKELRESKRENTTDDLATEEHKAIDGYSEFERGKHDPKYQTLPYNTKFSSGRTGRHEQESSDEPQENAPDALNDVKYASTGQPADKNGSSVNGTMPAVQTRFVPTWDEHGHPTQNTSTGQNTENKSSLPATSLSVSFAHKLSPGVTAYSQNRMLNYAKLKENELLVKKGVTGLINDYEGEVIGKPQLPPKPPIRPTPPPRQKGEPGSVDVSETLIPKISVQTRPQQAYRYASHDVIMSTYTQKQDQIATQKGDQDANKEDDTKVHVSINRRIEMPPAFMFPESQIPPTDLLKQGGFEVQAEQADAEISNSSPLTGEQKDVICANGALKQLLNERENKSLSQQLSNLAVKDSPSDSIYSYAPQITDSRPQIVEGRQQIDVTDDAMISREENKFNFEIFEVSDNCNSEYRDNSCSSEEAGNSSESATEQPRQIEIVDSEGNVVINRRVKKGNLKTNPSRTDNRRVSFDPLALLLDASLEGELDLVKKTAKEVPNPSAANDEGITALHNAICAGHLDIVTFLVLYGYDVNAQDADGWTPLHCAASCNNVQMARFLVDHGACVLATTLLDHETAAEKCEQEEDGFDSCSQYLYSVQEKLGIMNGGVVYAVYDYEAQTEDEISFSNGDAITVLRRGDEYERNWWWSRLDDSCGYVPRNLLGLYPRVKNPIRDS